MDGGHGSHASHGGTTNCGSHGRMVNSVKLFDRLAHHPNGHGRNGHGDVPLDEALADFRLACISRALDDREIALRQQNRVFFQISGAGHEALLLGLARSLRAGLRLVLPLLPRPRARRSALGVTPLEMLLQAVGAADDPASGGRQMPCHWGDAARSTSSARRRVDREPVPPRGRLRGGGALHRPPAATFPAAPRTATRSPTCRSAKARLRRRVLGER